MLASRKISEVLRSTLSDGIEGIILMTSEGTVMASEFLKPSKDGIFEDSIAALTSQMWTNYLIVPTEISFQLMKFEEGTLALTTASNSRYLIAAYGSSNSPIGLLKGRLEALSNYFTRMFEQLK